MIASSDESMIADKKWTTVANVFIRGGADGKSLYGFHAYDADREQKSLHLELLKPGGHEDLGNDSMKKGQKPVKFSFTTIPMLLRQSTCLMSARLQPGFWVEMRLK